VIARIGRMLLRIQNGRSQHGIAEMSPAGGFLKRLQRGARLRSEARLDLFRSGFQQLEIAAWESRCPCGSRESQADRELDAGQIRSSSVTRNPFRAGRARQAAVWSGC